MNHIFSYSFLKGAWRAKHIVREIDCNTVLSCVIGVRRGQRKRAKGEEIGNIAFSLSPPLLPLPSLLLLLLLLLSSHNVCLESLGPGSNHDPGALGDSQFLD